MSWVPNRLRELAAACMLLTRLPIWRLHTTPPANPRTAVWAYPLVGALIGLIGAVVFGVLHQLGVPALPTAALSLTAQLLATGALHEDGLADMADGFGGGADRSRKLEIMRDSRIGAYGTLALVLSTILRITALAVTAHPLLWLIVIGAMSRAAMLGLLATTPPARRDGIAAALRSLPRVAVGFAMAMAVMAGLLLPYGLLAMALCVGVTFGLRWLTLRQIEGQTGDVLGACAVLSECALWCLA